MSRYFGHRLLCGVMLLALALTSLGCSICCTPHYDMYPAYGGAWERTNRTHGRVGSIFEPAGARMVDAPQDYDIEAVAPADSDGEETDEGPDPTEQTLPPLPDEMRPAEPALPLESAPTNGHEESVIAMTLLRGGGYPSLRTHVC